MTTLIEGKYEVIGKIKEGGMGAIYRVRHLLLDEIRVIKLMRTNLEEDPDARRRFYQEARLATSLKHPNIAAFHDFSEDQNHNFYMVMEYIEGVNLAEFTARNGPPPLVTALEIAIQTLKALGYLHRRGVVHRDISPENLMLTQDPDGRLLVKLIDLGIAKQTESEGMTKTGLFLGKLKYGSPEQLGVLSKGEKIDGRSDLYSLGCVLYQMVTGTAPYEAQNPSEYVMAHLMKGPRPFEETDPRGKVPETIRAIILKSLAKDRRDRYATADDLGLALREYQDQLSAPGLNLGADALSATAGKGVHRDPTSSISDVQKLVAKAFTTSKTPEPSERGRVLHTPTGQMLPRSYEPAGEPSASSESADRTLTARWRDGARSVNVPAPPIESENTEVWTDELLDASGVPEPAPPPRASPPLPFADRATPEGPLPKSRAPLVFAACGALTLAIAVGIILNSRVKGGARRPGAVPPSGVVLLTASPWGTIVRIHSESEGKDIAFPAAATPARMALPAGRYVFTVRWPGPEAKGDASVTVDVLPARVVAANVEVPGFEVERAVQTYVPY